MAKDSGRGRYHLYKDESNRLAPAADYVNTAQMLRRGLEQDQFSLDFQQITDASGQCRGYEALLRLNTPDGGVVGPDAFLPIAKRLGMMRRIDRWVVTEALALVSDHEQRGLSTWR